MARWTAWWARPWGPYVASLVLQAALAPWVIHDWDGFVFQRTVEDLLDGRTPYAVAAEGPSHIYLNEAWPSPNSWFAYPPGALLLMTPLLAPALLAGVAAEPALRLALKLPMIAAGLALAWVVGRIVQDLGGDAKARRRAEVFVLLNPFLIFVAAAWGMFDAAMMALLLLSALLLARGRPVAAGIAFGASALVKVFPLFVAPAFLAVALRGLPRRRDAGAFVGAAVATFGLVCLPFLLSSPSGFWQQVVGMHLARPPQGFPPLGLLYLPRFTERFGASPWPLPEEWVGPALSFALLAPALLLAYAFAATGRPDLRRLLHATLVGLLATLVFGKVVNEQYFVMPVAVLAALAFAPGASRLERAALHAWTWGGLVAALVVGFHFLTFLPRETALALLGMTSAQAIHGLGVFAHAALGVPPEAFYPLSDLVASLAVAPAFVLGAWLAARTLAGGLREAAAGLRGRAARPLVAVGLAALVLSGPAAFAATLEARPGAPPPMPALGERIVGATYLTWWNNPSRDPSVPDGNWDHHSLTPAQGYFTTNGHQIEKDVDAMVAAGIDFAAVYYHGYDHARYEVFSKVARAKGLRFAPLVDAQEVVGHDEHRATGPDPRAPRAMRPDPATALALRALVEQSLKLAGSEAFLRVDGRPVVFVSDLHLVGWSWDEPSRRALAEEVLALHGGSFGNLSAAWGKPLATVEAVMAAFPDDVDAFGAATREAADWRKALDARRAALVDEVRNASAERLFLVGTQPATFDRMADATLLWTGPGLVDGAFAPPPLPADLRPPAAWDRERNLTAWLAQGQVHAIRHGEGAFASVFHAADDTAYRHPGVAARVPPDEPLLGGDAYRATWDQAIAQGATRVLIHSWNHYFEGTAVAPTVEHGERALDATRGHVARFKAAQPDGQPRVLAVVHERGGLVEGDRPGKDWTFSLSAQLPWRLARAMPGARVEVAQIDDPDLADRVRDATPPYDVVWLEPGRPEIAAPRDRLEEAHRALLVDHVHLRGGSLVVLGANVPEPFLGAFLAAGVADLREDPVRVEWPGGAASYPWTDRNIAVRVADGCAALMTFAESGTPAAWSCDLGFGRVVATAFRPQGWDDRIDPGSDAAMRLLMEAALARCTAETVAQVREAHGLEAPCADA